MSSEKILKQTKPTGEWLRGFVKNNGAIVIFIIIFVFALIFIRNFASTENMLNIVKQAAIPIIACIGMTMVLMTGGIDLSLGYNIGFTSVVAGLLIKTLGMPVPLGVIAALAVGLAIGFGNGLLVDKVKVPAFITTLGTGYILLGAAQIISKGETINKLPEDFLAIGTTQVGELNTTVLIAIVVAVIFYIILQRSTYGRALAAFGYNQRASFVSGVPTSRIHISAYAICGLLSALAGVLLTIRVNCAQPDMGGGDYTFQIVTAAIVGGASLFGGKGTVVGSIFGVFIIKVIENCINLMGVQYFLYQAVMGIVILLALIFECIKNKKL